MELRRGFGIETVSRRRTGIKFQILSTSSYGAFMYMSSIRMISRTIGGVIIS